MRFLKWNISKGEGVRPVTSIKCDHRLLISASRGSSLAVDHCPPVENVASLVNGFLIHVVVSHRHLHVTVA